MVDMKIKGDCKCEKNFITLHNLVLQNQVNMLKIKSIT